MRGSKSDMKITFDEGGVVVQDAVWGDFHVAFETFRERFDAAPLHKGLPDDQCQCPHWGYALKGKMRVVYTDHEEIAQAGDAYYIEPGHNAVYEAGTETVEFSPNELFQKIMEAAVRNLGGIRNA